MNTASEMLSKELETEAEATQLQPLPQTNDPLVELGKVSDTRGGWWGVKVDAGMGVQVY